MTNVEIKYAFPLFTKHNSTDYLIKHDQIRVSDIWSFWQYLIERYVKKYSGEKNFLQTLIEQAQYFYEAAERAPLQSKPLLYYYSFVVFLKAVSMAQNVICWTDIWHLVLISTSSSP